jgi:hypothetical protein
MLSFSTLIDLSDLSDLSSDSFLLLLFLPINSVIVRCLSLLSSFVYFVRWLVEFEQRVLDFLIRMMIFGVWMVLGVGSQRWEEVLNIMMF